MFVLMESVRRRETGGRKFVEAVMLMSAVVSGGIEFCEVKKVV